jgi:RNA polymerase sigma-70 factor (ECF subfamily)
MLFSRKTVAASSALLGLAAMDVASPAMKHVASLEQYFAEHYEPLYRFLCSCGTGEPTAEDLTQEAFLRLHDHLTRGRPAQNVRAWLFRVAYRLWIDRWRQGQREAPAQGAAWEVWRDVLPDPARGAEQDLLAREREQWLRTAVLGLSQLERQALHLRADGLRYREIADVLGVGYWPVVEAVRRALDILGEQAHGR